MYKKIYCDLKRTLNSERVIFDETIAYKNKLEDFGIVLDRRGMFGSYMLMVILLMVSLGIFFSSWFIMPSLKNIIEYDLNFIRLISFFISSASMVTFSTMLITKTVKALSAKRYIITDKALYMCGKNQCRAERIPYARLKSIKRECVKKDKNDITKNLYEAEVLYTIPSSDVSITSGITVVTYIRSCENLEKICDYIEAAKNGRLNMLDTSGMIAAPPDRKGLTAQHGNMNSLTINGGTHVAYNVQTDAKECEKALAALNGKKSGAYAAYNPQTEQNVAKVLGNVSAAPNGKKAVTLSKPTDVKASDDSFDNLLRKHYQNKGRK